MPNPKTVYSDKIEKRDSGIHGIGLYAIEPVEEGEVLLVKGGHVLNRTTRDRVAKVLGSKAVQIADDLFVGPTSSAERDDCMLQLNHSCNPNAGVLGQIIFVAMRDIAPGEEITLDYAMTDNDNYKMDCQCGTKLCRGTVTGQDWRLPDLHNRYAGYFSAYLDSKITGGF